MPRRNKNVREKNVSRAAQKKRGKPRRQKGVNNGNSNSIRRPEVR